MSPPPLHDYQRVARDYLLSKDRAALFLDMGLGKTCITLNALTPEHLPALVCAPKRVAENVWPVETPKWRPDLRIAVAAGSPTKRQLALANPKADIVVIGRDNLADAIPYAGRFKTLVLDELSGFKTRKTARWKAAKKIAERVRHVWGLTGTPSPNGLLDLWAQVYLLDGGARLGRTLTSYRSRWFMPGRTLPSGVITEWITLPESPGHIHRLLEDIALSMSADDRLDLPPVTYNPVEVTLPPKVKAVYKAMKKDLVADLQLLGGEIHTASNAAILTSKLSQITAGFLYGDDNDIRPSKTILHWEKARAVEEIVDGTGSPVLVFYHYKAELEMLEQTLGARAHRIDEPGIIPAWNRGEVPVLLAHPASAGHGLNLQAGGHTVVWTTLPWSLEEWEQGNARLARQGQTNPVVVHMLLAPRTVDEAIRARLEEKTSVQDALLNHLESPL